MFFFKTNEKLSSTQNQANKKCWKLKKDFKYKTAYNMSSSFSKISTLTRVGPS
jgi:hypothetical protein